MESGKKEKVKDKRGSGLSFLGKQFRRLTGANIRSDFFKNVLVTFSGTATASLISFLLTPIVTRLFDPDEFGQVAFIITLTTNIGLVSTLAFPQALVLPRSRTAFYQLVRLCFVLLGIALLAVTLVVIFFGTPLLRWFNMEEVQGYLWLLPVFILLNELNRLAVNWNVRRKRFRQNAAAGVTNNLSIRITQMGYGWWVNANLGGLLIGNFVAYVLRLAVLLKGQWREFFRLLFRIRRPELQEVVKTYKNYPRWIFPAVLVDAISTSLPVYLLAVYFDAAIVGHFAFAQSLLNHPYTMLSASITPVFFQRAHEVYQEGLERLQAFSLGIFRRLTILSAIVFGAAIFFSDWVLPLIFGPKWVLSGVFAGSLAIYFTFRFISVPLLPVFRVMQKESYLLIGNGSIFFFRLCGILVGVLFFSAETTILLFSIAGAIPCLLNSLMVFRVLEMPVGRILLRALLIFGAAIAFFATLRQILEIWI